jgi:hypothetical protein
MIISKYNNDNISTISCYNNNFFFRFNCKENQITFYTQYLLSENCILYEIMWKIMGDPDRPHMRL